MSPVQRTRHTVYDLKYHIVWVPKYRKLVLQGNISKRLKQIYQGVAERYDFAIDAMEVMEENHVHFFYCTTPLCTSRDCTNNEEYICQEGI